MKKTLKITMTIALFCAMSFSFVVPSIGQAEPPTIEDGGGASCTTGSTGLCWIITTNGNQTAKCKSTTGSVKDCA